MDTLLELKDIGKQYQRRAALQGVDLSLKRGESIALFGPNGAGKTTLMKIISGLMAPTRGEFLFCGKPASESPLRRETFYLGHKNALYGGLTVLENMNFTERLHNMRDGGSVEAVLREHGFWERRNDTVRELSQGMKRRLAFARAFVMKPALMVLDEPFVGLDIKWRRSVMEKIHEMKQAGVTLVLSTHLVDEGYELAERIMFLDKGRALFTKCRDEVGVDEIKDMFEGTPLPVRLAC